MQPNFCKQKKMLNSILVWRLLKSPWNHRDSFRESCSSVNRNDPQVAVAVYFVCFFSNLYRVQCQPKNYNLCISQVFPFHSLGRKKPSGNKTASSLFIYMFLSPSETNVALNAVLTPFNAVELYYSSIALPPFQHQLDVFNRSGGKEKKWCNYSCFVFSGSH